MYGDHLVRMHGHAASALCGRWAAGATTECFLQTLANLVMDEPGIGQMEWMIWLARVILVGAKQLVNVLVQEVPHWSWADGCDTRTGRGASCSSWAFDGDAWAGMQFCWLGSCAGADR